MVHYFCQFVVTRLLESCQNYVMSKQSNLTHWHPVLGWFAQGTDSALSESMPLVRSQLQLLWSGPMVGTLLGRVLDETEMMPESVDSVPSNLLRRALMDHRNSGARNRLGSAESSKISLLCSLYQTALATFTQLRLDILTGRVYVSVCLLPLL